MVNTVLTDGPTTTVASLHIQRLSMFPWFHLHLSRTASERLLLYNGVDGHGLFLVRQSETRPGDFVLSFNCGGKANVRFYSNLWVVKLCCCFAHRFQLQ